MKFLLVLVMLVAACGGGADPTPRPPDPTERPTPPPAWRLSVTDVTYTATLSLGDTIEIDVTIENRGTDRNLRTRFQFSDIDDYADLIGCVPECTYEDFFGIYTTLPGIAAGETVVYHVEFLAKSLGVADWSLCVYDAETFGEQVYCGTGSTTIGS